MISPAKHEASIREAIILSARRMVAGVEVAKRERARMGDLFTALDAHCDRGAMSRLARDTGISRQLVCEVVRGRKKIGAVAARRMAKAKV